jgi:hypothetical protein
MTRLEKNRMTLSNFSIKRKNYADTVYTSLDIKIFFDETRENSQLQFGPSKFKAIEKWVDKLFLDL